jgi:hypothetical protein
MVLDELLSFHKYFWPSHFPIEARYYEYGASGPSRTLWTRRISTPEELRAFQEDLTKREQLREWSFLAYYEPLGIVGMDGRGV